MSKKKGYSAYRRKRRDGKRETTWTVAFHDGNGKRQFVRGIASQAIAEEIGRAKAVERDRVRGGVISPAEAKAKEASTLAISEHIKAWARAMKARGVTKGHHEIQSYRVAEIAKHGRMRSLADISGEKVQAGCAMVASSTSPQNARHYFTAFKAFVYWCLETGRLTHDPIAGAKRPKADGEVFQRTPIPPEKLADLIQATRDRDYPKGKRPAHANEDRAKFYLLLAHTGLRRREAESVTPESFHDQSVTVKASYTKNGAEATQPLRADVWGEICDWLRNKKPRRRVFDFGKHWSCEELFKGDCAAAGIKPTEGERLGVHSLRRLYITELVRAGGLKVAQDLARHSTPTLTAKYSDLTMKDYRKAIAGLPEIKGSAEQKARTA